MSRWRRICGYIERHADPDGWVLWSKMIQDLGLSAPQIKATIREHRNELEARRYRRPGDRPWGRPRHELRLQRAVPREHHDISD